MNHVPGFLIMNHCFRLLTSIGFGSELWVEATLLGVFNRDEDTL